MTEIYCNMNRVRHGPGPPFYHPQQGLRELLRRSNSRSTSGSNLVVCCSASLRPAYPGSTPVHIYACTRDMDVWPVGFTSARRSRVAPSLAMSYDAAHSCRASLSRLSQHSEMSLLTRRPLTNDTSPPATTLSWGLSTLESLQPASSGNVAESARTG